MTDLLPCPFCGGDAVTPKIGDSGRLITKCSNRCPAGDWWSAVTDWNKRCAPVDQKAMFEQFVVSLAESERKLKIAEKKLERIDALIETGCKTIGGEMLVILPIQAILGESDDNGADRRK